METWSEGSAKTAGAYQIGREEVMAGTDRMIVNVPTGADFAVKVNGVDKLTLDPTGAATFASTAAFTGAVTFNGGYTGQPSLLATVNSINLKNTGATTLYTVPGGKTLIVLDIIIYATSVNTLAVAPIVRAGKTPLFTEFLALTTLTGLDTTGEYMSLSSTALGLIHSVFAAGEVLSLSVGTGATATTMTASAYVIGILI